jgi:hypothetical protein
MGVILTVIVKTQTPSKVLQFPASVSYVFGFMFVSRSGNFCALGKPVMWKIQVHVFN